MEKSKQKSTSWGWIIFWFVIFWPVGIFLLLKKLNSDKTATLEKGKTVTIISYVLIGFGVIYFLMAITEDIGMMMPALLFGGGGVWVNQIARKMKRSGERYKKYINLIVNHSQTNIDYIASTLELPYETVTQDLHKMIDLGYFADAYINSANREIILPQAGEPQPSQQTPDIQKQVSIITCNRCGAHNKVFEQFNECEYCNSPLQS